MNRVPCVICGYDQPWHEGRGEMLHDFRPATPPAVRTGEDDEADVEDLRARVRELERLLIVERDARDRDHAARPLVSGTANRDNVALRSLAEWLVSLDDDDPESPGRQDRRTVTLTAIVERARLALLGGDQ